MTNKLKTYKYNHLAKKDRHILNLVVSKKTGKPLLAYTNPEGKFVGKPVTKKYLDNFTNVLEPYYIFKKWYQHYNPDKLTNPDFLSETLEKYRGHEDVALNRMYRLYVDENWIAKPLWFTAEHRVTPRGELQSMEEFYKLNP